MPWERIYYKSLKVAYLKTQCRRHWMKEGTVSSGVALRPRPTEVQPHFLGSKWFLLIIIWIFFIISKCHFCILTSVTIFILIVTFAYWLLLPSSRCESLLHIDFCYQVLVMSHFRILTSVTKFLLWVTFAYWLLLPYSFCESLLYIDFCYQALSLSTILIPMPSIGGLIMVPY